jgi:hypothetical protein
MIPATQFKHLMGACLAVVLAVMLWSQWRGKENVLIDKWWYSVTAKRQVGRYPDLARS